MEDKVNRFGLCPNCATNWNGPDILESISMLACNNKKTEKELKAIAANYGWSEHNRTNFSNTISHEVDGKILLECPKMSCGHIFDRYTGEEYRNMFDAHRGIVVAKVVAPTEIDDVPF
jgi:hypothetical protein